MILLPGCTASLNTACRTHSIVLYDGYVDRGRIPNDHDVVSISLSHVPSGLEAVCIDVGCQARFEVPAGMLQAGSNLLRALEIDDVLPLSRSFFMSTKLEFRFGAEYLASHEEASEVEGSHEEVTYSDSETEFYDGLNVVQGRRVHRRVVPTGSTVRVVTRDVDVVIPDVSLVVRPGADRYDRGGAVVPLWEAVSVDADYARTLVEKGREVRFDGDFESVQGSFTVRVKNQVRFREGLAGKIYSF